MPTERLTEEGVRKLKPTEGKQVPYFDEHTRGLVLTVNPGGSKTWSVVYYVQGKPRYQTLGRYSDQLTLSKARERAKIFLGDLAHARVQADRALAEAQEKARRFLADPQQQPETFIADLQAAQAQARAFLANPYRPLQDATFKDVAGEFIKRHVEKNNLRSQREIERCLRVYVTPKWQNRFFVDLRKTDVTKLLDGIEDKHGSSQANAVLAIIRKIMNWYQANNDGYVSPVVKGMSRGAATKRDRILNDDELRAMWTTCDAMRSIDNDHLARTFADITKVCLLTAQRREKVVTMKWSDIEDGVWTVPVSDREKGHGGALELPQIVLDVLFSRPRLMGNPHVFAATKGSGPFNAWSDGKSKLDARLPQEMPHWVIHDLRRTARSLMSRAGVNSEHAERVLGHAIPGVEGIYNRHHYMVEKGKALASLAALIESIVNPPPANVVGLNERRRSRARNKAMG